MTFYFKSYAYDAALRELRRGKKHIALRPKTAQLLNILLAGSDGVLAKNELIERVWGHDHIEDQALFQLISDIRRALGDRRCIATYPNQGYRWAWPLRAAKRPRWPLFATAASIVAATIIWLSLPGPDAARYELSPAMSALSSGIAARREGDLDRALNHLSLAIAANPNFAAARLELANTLRLTGDLEAAQAQAYDALSVARIVSDRYLEATAHVLLSQLRWAQGDLAGAMQLNSEAKRIATDHGLVCASQISIAWQQQLALALTQHSPGKNTHPERSLIVACAEALGKPQAAVYSDQPATFLAKQPPIPVHDMGEVNRATIPATNETSPQPA